MKTLAIVYHSGYGHTEVIANAVKKGAESLCNIQFIKISQEGKITDAEWKALEEADGIVFGAPTYMGSASGPFKMFADQTSRPWSQHKWKDKIAGGFTNSLSLSGDKLTALFQMVVLASQHGMIWVGPALMSDGKGPENINRIGSYIGTMAQSDNAAPSKTPPAGDIKTAELYGKRLAEAVNKWTRDK